jgi:hypothetical protein
MSRSLLIFVLLLLTALSAAAKLPLEYLAKLENIQPGKYGEVLTQYLLFTPGDFGRVVILPSFKTETAVSVYSVPNPGSSKAGFIYRITVTFANESLWDMIQGSSPIKDPSISRHDLDIDADLAFAVQRAWRAVLAKDPVSTEDPDITFDGTIYAFSVVMPDGKTIFREAANPRRPPATDLAGAGIDLWGYATAPEEDRKTKRKKLMRTLHDLAESHGKP